MATKVTMSKLGVKELVETSRLFLEMNNMFMQSASVNWHPPMPSQVLIYWHLLTRRDCNHNWLHLLPLWMCSIIALATTGSCTHLGNLSFFILVESIDPSYEMRWKWWRCTFPLNVYSVIWMNLSPSMMRDNECFNWKYITMATGDRLSCQRGVNYFYFYYFCPFSLSVAMTVPWNKCIDHFVL